MKSAILNYLRFLLIGCNPCPHGVVGKVLGSVLYDEMGALTHDVCSSSSQVINTNCHAIKMKLSKEFVSLLPSFKSAKEVCI